MEPTSTGTAHNGDTELYYESFGGPDAPAVLLVNGLGSQLINFDPVFCAMFVDRGFRVIRFDNRDVGLSSKTEGRPPSLKAVLEAHSARRTPEVPYTLSDMAADAVAVLDAAGVGRAHLWGMSMGGMIVQTIAVEFSDRVASLTSVMSTTGSGKVGNATPDAMKVLTTPPPADRDGAVSHGVHTSSVLSGTLFNPARSRAEREAAFDRCHHPLGTAFQMAAITAAGNRTAALASISAPTMVIHGRLDPLIDLSGGEATAEVIANAELVIYDEMGHDIPEPLWDSYVADLQRLVARAG